MLIAKLVAADGSGAKYALKWQGVHEASLKPVLRDTEVKVKDTEGDEDVIADVRTRSLTKGMAFVRFPDGGLRCGRRGDTRLLGVFVEEKDAPDGGVFRFADSGADAPEKSVEVRETVKEFVPPESIAGWAEFLRKLSPESLDALADAMLSRSTGIVQTGDAARPEAAPTESPAEKAMRIADEIAAYEAKTKRPASKPAQKPAQKPAKGAASKPAEKAKGSGKAR